MTVSRICRWVVFFGFFRLSNSCFGGGLGMLGCGGMGMGPWGGGMPGGAFGGGAFSGGAFGWNGGLIGTDWSLGLGGYPPFLGAYGAPYTGGYASGIYAAAPTAALIGPCCATTFGGVIGFRRRKRRTFEDAMPATTFVANSSFKSDHVHFHNGGHWS